MSPRETTRRDAISRASGGAPDEPRELIGRERERALLPDLLHGNHDRKPGIVLVAGEAGIGKTRLMDEVLAQLDRPVLRGAAVAGSTPPYGPLVQAIRAYARDHVDELLELPLAAHLTPLLPELALPPIESDLATLTAAICDALEAAGRGEAILALEDFHWADRATLDVLPELAAVPERSKLRIVATYRNDELPRLHHLRHTRTQLRRAGRLHEILVPPLSAEEAERLAREIAGRELSEEACRTIVERSDGIPFFIEELAAAMASDQGTSGSTEAQEPPESLRDSIRLRTSALDPVVTEVLETMATLGVNVDLSLLADVVDPDALTLLIEHGWLVEVDGRTASFRHALVRDAVYSDIPWLRRRERHGYLAERLEARGAAPEEIAHQWLAAREPLRARPHLLRAARSFCAVHAYGDARGLLLEALKDWDGEEVEAGRLDALELLARCTELSGDPAEAVRIWRQVTKGREQLDDAQGMATAQRRLATLLEMRGDWDDAVTAHVVAADGFDRSGQPADAAIERLAVAAHLTSAGDSKAALALVQQSAADAEIAGDDELRLRTLALEGNIRAKLGEPAGVPMVQEALERALDEEYAAPTAEAYFRLASALESDAHYAEAVDAYQTAFAFCRTHGLEGMDQVCFACLTPVMRHIGRWKEATEVSRSVLALADAPPVARNVAAGELGLIHAIKGNIVSARRFLTPSLAFAGTNEIFGLVVECAWGIAMVQSLEGKNEEASTTALELVEGCRRRDEWHYSVSAMRWASMWFSSQQDERGLLSAIDVLSTAASGKGSTEAKATLAYGLVEVGLMHGDVDQAVVQAGQTVNLLEGLGAPYEVAEMRARCAVALAAAGRRDPAIGLLTASYRTAKKLGARPLANRVVGQFEALGEPVERHLGRGVTMKGARAGLSPREIDVLRYVATGRTNKQIAEVLFLSTRTVDMHVRNILMKLDCRTRAEAVRRAGELRLLEAPETTA